MNYGQRQHSTEKKGRSILLLYTIHGPEGADKAGQCSCDSPDLTVQTVPEQIAR